MVSSGLTMANILNQLISSSTYVACRSVSSVVCWASVSVDIAIPHSHHPTLANVLPAAAPQSLQVTPVGVCPHTFCCCVRATLLAAGFSPPGSYQPNSACLPASTFRWPAPSAQQCSQDGKWMRLFCGFTTVQEAQLSSRPRTSYYILGRIKEHDKISAPVKKVLLVYSHF